MPARLAAIAIAAAALASSCASVPHVPASGELAGHSIDTTVDSRIARYYLERLQQGARAEPVLDARIDALELRFDRPAPTREDLAAISRETSVDLAALFFAHRLLADACNRQVHAEFMRIAADPRLRKRENRAFFLLFVPGWDYVNNGPSTGADFARPRMLATELGFENRLAALAPNASIEANAEALAAEIAALARSGRKLILAGASSAGPAVHLALAHLGVPERAAVAGWINIGGILQGTPMVERYLYGPRRAIFEIGLALKGWDRHAVVSLGTTAGRERFASLPLDRSIFVVSYVGIPLSGQVGAHARRNYPVLARDGPNDGITLLADSIAPHGPIVPAIGSDHFFAAGHHHDASTAALMVLMARHAAIPPRNRCLSAR